MLNASQIKNKAGIGFDNLIQENQKIDHLIKHLKHIGDVFLIGGALRDFALNEVPRDIDLMIDAPANHLATLLDNYYYRVNRFGGFNVLIDDVEFDIWSVHNNWAFENNYYETKFNNITKGAFFNFDAIALNLSDGALDATKFIDAANKKLLDINLHTDFIDSNPNPEKNVLRALRLKKKWSLRLSPTAKEYCQCWYDKQDHPIDYIMYLEEQHYGNSILKTTDFDFFRKI
ncbi:hypothetical protein UP15_01215 [Bacillus pumilus]|uniref:hypothetical protein n=1 Tax=Bacillus TaxID=1386 RepID=UPI00028E9024|nr:MULTISPECIES: hypothetical protein [Bacillus]AMM87668.1 hypothetical protein UP15_01215 [Bacillus pumilus]EKF35011.1 hypothetical protein BA1_12469 [Bacillus xiamenensis]MCA0164457.1 hypothetical protein [Bacillus sp. RAR_M1_44]MCW1837257.1 hypothetical protein [Bacillus xiamenensis]PGD40543.1 hypothetical protein COM17_18200 [Bacillus altitudinis]